MNNYTARHPAAFINIIAEEGTKADAVEYLQRTWDELCELRARPPYLKRSTAPDDISDNSSGGPPPTWPHAEKIPAWLDPEST